MDQTRTKEAYSAHEDLILVVDDEQDIRALLRILLEKEGGAVAEASNGKEAVDFVGAHTGAVTLVVLRMGDVQAPCA